MPKPAPALRRSRQQALYKRALETMPGGTDSNFRAWGDDTVYIDRGEGGRIWAWTATSLSTCGWAMGR